MLLCSSCAAEGTHKRCSSLTDSATSWECGSCAPLDTAPGNESELDIPDLGTQDSSSSTSPGPDLTQNGSCQQGQAPDPQGQRRTLRDRTHVPTPSAGQRQPRQRQSGTSRRQNCSRLQRQTPDPPIGSTSPHDRSCVRPSGIASRTSGTSRRQNCSRQRQNSNSSSLSRRPHDRSCPPAPSAGRRNRRENASGTSRKGNHSCLQWHNPDPPGRSTSPHDRSHVRPSKKLFTPKQVTISGEKRFVFLHWFLKS
ncbi:uncharacterized protein [Pithys albifrons albifrons]